MLSWFKNLFSQSSDVSMTRFLSFICVVTACTLAFVKGPDSGSLVTTFLMTGLGAKVSQKFIENKTSQIEAAPPAVESQK